MPINLTTPLVLPAHDSAAQQTFNEVKIVNWDPRHEERSLTIFAQYGNTVDGAWVGADGIETHAVVFEDRGPQTGAGGIEIDEDLAYSDLIAGALIPAGAEGQPVFGVVKLALYAALVSRVSIYAGTVV